MVFVPFRFLWQCVIIGIQNPLHEQCREQEKRNKHAVASLDYPSRNTNRMTWQLNKHSELKENPLCSPWRIERRRKTKRLICSFVRFWFRCFVSVVVSHRLEKCLLSDESSRRDNSSSFVNDFMSTRMTTYERCWMHFQRWSERHAKCHQHFGGDGKVPAK